MVVVVVLAVAVVAVVAVVVVLVVVVVVVVVDVVEHFMGERVFRQGTHHPLGTLKHQVLLVIVRLYRTSTSTEALHE